MMTIARPALSAQTTALLRTSPVVALLGPRQSGKTTLAGQVVAGKRVERFDLEDPRDARRLSEPMTALEGLQGLVVIDEVQRQPDLFSILRVLSDRRPLPARFLVLGSASPDLLKQSSETLTGRLETVPLEGFRLADLGAAAQGRHWLRGGAESGPGRARNRLSDDVHAHVAARLTLAAMTSVKPRTANRVAL